MNRWLLASLQRRRRPDGRRLILSRDLNDTEDCVVRANALAGQFGVDAEVSAWKLDHEQPFANTQSTLLDIWLETFGGPYMK